MNPDMNLTAIDREITELEEQIRHAEGRIVKRTVLLSKSLARHLDLEPDAGYFASEIKMRHESIQIDVALIDLCYEKLELLNKLKES